MASADAGPPLHPSEIIRKPPSVPRGVIVATLAILLAFVATQGRSLWLEWIDLQDDMAVVRRTAVVGYLNIHPNPSYARKPDNWFHDEGEFTLLWSGWKPGDGHRWFRVRRGEVDQTRISTPFGRDVIQAIDYPVIETGGGTIWKKIPSEAPVVGIDLNGTMVVYPLQVLDKVCVVNDVIGERPVLVTYNPSPLGDRTVHIYEPIIEGQRVTMGLSGYFQDHKPLLYDRGTESLWIDDGNGLLKAIAGQRKGAQLRQIVHPVTLAWGNWRSQHPQSRLLVGADRSKLLPTF
jgi:hypothetical protein